MATRYQVTVLGRRNGPYSGTSREYTAGAQRVEGGALILTKPHGAGYAPQPWPPNDEPDWLLIPLDTIDTVEVRAFEIEESD